MGLFEQFPFTNYQQLNIDWILKNQKELSDQIKQILGESVIKDSKMFWFESLLDAQKASFNIGDIIFTSGYKNSGTPGIFIAANSGLSTKGTTFLRPIGDCPIEAIGDTGDTMFDNAAKLPDTNFYLNGDITVSGQHSFSRFSLDGHGHTIFWTFWDHNLEPFMIRTKDLILTDCTINGVATTQWDTDYHEMNFNHVVHCSGDMYINNCNFSNIWGTVLSSEGELTKIENCTFNNVGGSYKERNEYDAFGDILWAGRGASPKIFFTGNTCNMYTNGTRYSRTAIVTEFGGNYEVLISNSNLRNCERTLHAESPVGALHTHVIYDNCEIKASLAVFNYQSETDAEFRNCKININGYYGGKCGFACQTLKLTNCKIVSSNSTLFYVTDKVTADNSDITINTSENYIQFFMIFVNSVFSNCRFFSNARSNLGSADASFSGKYLYISCDFTGIATGSEVYGNKTSNALLCKNAENIYNMNVISV